MSFQFTTWIYIVLVGFITINNGMETITVKIGDEDYKMPRKQLENSVTLQNMLEDFSTKGAPSMTALLDLTDTISPEIWEVITMPALVQAEKYQLTKPAYLTEKSYKRLLIQTVHTANRLDIKHLLEQSALQLTELLTDIELKELNENAAQKIDTKSLWAQLDKNAYKHILGGILKSHCSYKKSSIGMEIGDNTDLPISGQDSHVEPTTTLLDLKKSPYFNWIKEDDRTKIAISEDGKTLIHCSIYDDEWWSELKIAVYSTAFGILLHRKSEILKIHEKKYLRPQKITSLYFTNSKLAITMEGTKYLIKTTIELSDREEHVAIDELTLYLSSAQKTSPPFFSYAIPCIFSASIGKKPVYITPDNPLYTHLKNKGAVIKSVVYDKPNIKGEDELFFDDTSYDSFKCGCRGRDVACGCSPKEHKLELKVYENRVLITKADGTELILMLPGPLASATSYDRYNDAATDDLERYDNLVIRFEDGSSTKYIIGDTKKPLPKTGLKKFLPSKKTIVAAVIGLAVLAWFKYKS
jgi:hypothetical protein